MKKLRVRTFPKSKWVRLDHVHGVIALWLFLPSRALLRELRIRPRMSYMVGRSSGAVMAVWPDTLLVKVHGTRDGPCNFFRPTPEGYKRVEQRLMKYGVPAPPWDLREFLEYKDTEPSRVLRRR